MFKYKKINYDNLNESKRNNGRPQSDYVVDYWSWRSHRQFFIRPYFNNKKEKRKIHHDSIIEILKNWSEIKFELVNQKDSLYTTSIPLYIDVIDRIDSLDEYKEVYSHLKHKKYSKILRSYDIVKKLQNEHNEKVSEFMNEREDEIKNEIAMNKNIFLKDVNFLKNRLKDINAVKDAVENGELTEQDIQAVKWGALDDSVGVYYDNFFNHLFKQANNAQKNIELKTDYFMKNGWAYPILFSANSREKIIAKGVAGSKSIQNLKKYMENQLDDIINKLKEFNLEVQKIETKFKDFHKEIIQIIHDYESLGLKGDCRIEIQSSLFKRFINRIKSCYYD